jgi:hypothetical protein
LEKIKNFTFEDNIMENHKQRKEKKNVKNEDSMGKSNFFLSTMPFNLWVVLATWLHIGALQQIHEK